MQTWLKSLLTFAQSDVKNAFPQSRNTFCVHRHDNRNTDVSGKLTEVYGAANQGVPGDMIGSDWLCTNIGSI